MKRNQRRVVESVTAEILGALGNVRLWSRGEPDSDLAGFVYKSERDDFVDGFNGPFWRVVKRGR